MENFQPPVNPPKLIDDPKDSKPADWVEEATIPDPDARKPEDWDEDAPPKILDENATKPDDWLEDEDVDIPDPDVEKPEDWNDEEDGDWIAPSIPNPKCQDNGCGPWTRPFIANPAYKGKWSPPLINNPAYKGVWAPRKISNPGYFEDLQPSSFEKIGAIGFEIWTMQNDILFDNIYIGHSVEDAKALAAETWEIKHLAEKKQEEIANPPPKPQLDYDWETFKREPVRVILEHLREFIELAREDPMNAINSRPLVTYGLTGLVGILFGLLLIVVGLMSGSSEDPDLSQVAQNKKTDGDPSPEDSTPTTESQEGKEGPVSRRKTKVADSNE